MIMHWNHIAEEPLEKDTIFKMISKKLPHYLENITISGALL